MTYRQQKWMDASLTVTEPVASSLCTLPRGPAQDAESKPWGILSSSSFASVALKPLQCSLLPAPTPSPHSDPWAASALPFGSLRLAYTPGGSPMTDTLVFARVVTWGGRNPKL